MLKDLRKKVAKARCSSFCSFSRPSWTIWHSNAPLHGGTFKSTWSGRGQGKKIWKRLFKTIEKYVHENDIIRPDDLIVKSTGVN